MPKQLAGLVVVVLVAWVAVGQDQETLERARRLAKDGRMGEACEAYDAWLATSPADRVVLREAATAAFRKRRFFEAAKWLERLVELEPNDPSVAYDLGALRVNQCRYDLAVPIFRQLETLEATDEGLAARGDHRFLHGEASRRLEHYGEAIAELSVASARAPTRGDYRTALGQALLDGGRFETAVTEFSKAVATDPSFENYYGLGVALGGTGKNDEAIAALREARRLNKNDGRVLLKLGTIFTWKKDLARAEAYLAEARQAAPRSVEILFALAQVQRLQGRLEEAAETRALGEAIKKESDTATERGRVFHRGLVTNPTNSAAHVTYGLDLLSQGRFDDAQAIFQRLLSFDPTNSLAILNLSSLLAKSGDVNGAMLEVRKMLEKDEGNELANLQAARIKLMTRDARGALDFLRRAVAKNPDSVAGHELLAATYRALGDVDAAAREEAIRLRLVQVESKPETR